MVLAGLLALLVAAPACGGSSETGEGREGDGAGSREGPAIAQDGEGDPLERVLDTREAEGGVGERVEVGKVSLRPFDVRTEDVVHYAPGPGRPVGEEDSPSGEFVAVDFVAQNDSGSTLRIRPQAVLEDDSGERHRRESPSTTSKPAGVRRAETASPSRTVPP